MPNIFQQAPVTMLLFKQTSLILAIINAIISYPQLLKLIILVGGKSCLHVAQNEVNESTSHVVC